ncbi:hypothetical protein QBC34DRAFT_429253 [Podospora aff. communis PSN243]|uniref:HMG box domain-containing protein n=1 Tax=Podospora aff. communis PSN243 TaxID=3040156 RepID=A0AAV9G9M9_9PEZI|nr:hypothetical protein QBC34DRAFT_429253 [Podospora aff. communis PSN243]
MGRSKTRQDDQQMGENSDAEAKSSAHEEAECAAAKSSRVTGTTRSRLADETATADSQDCIPRGLYDKAQNNPSQLTNPERQLLYDCGDVERRVLARPGFGLETREDQYQLMYWPPPDITSDNIKRATGGELTTPLQLYEKAKRAIDAKQPIGACLNDEELRLLARGFHGESDDGAFTSEVRLASLFQPGSGQAREVTAKQMKLDLSVFHAAAMCYAQRMAPAMSIMPFGLQVIRQGRGKNVAPMEVLRQWNALSPDQKAEYAEHEIRARAESDGKRGARRSPSSSPKSRTDASPERPDPITGFQLFRQRLGENVDSEEALQQWGALHPKQEAEYETRARAENAAAEIAYQQERVERLRRMYGEE